MLHFWQHDPDKRFTTIVPSINFMCKYSPIFRGKAEFISCRRVIHVRIHKISKACAVRTVILFHTDKDREVCKRRSIGVVTTNKQFN